MGVRTELVPLLEREAALASLGEYAAQARAGNGRLVLVAGEAGVGKSALVDRFRAMLPDARWWWASRDGLFTPRPLGPLFDLAAQLGGDLADLLGAEHGVSYLRYWVDERRGRIFCLVEAPPADAAAAVHREAHGLVAQEILQVQEGC